MTVKAWLESAVQDAERRALPLRALLEALARSTTTLRDADWNLDATGAPEGAPYEARGEIPSLPPSDAR